MGQSTSWLVNTGTWGIAFANNRINPTGQPMETPRGVFKRLTRRLSTPVVRKATYQAMRIMGTQFVLGRTIEEALKTVVLIAIKATRTLTICLARRH